MSSSPLVSLGTFQHFPYMISHSLHLIYISSAYHEETLPPSLSVIVVVVAAAAEPPYYYKGLSHMFGNTSKNLNLDRMNEHFDCFYNDSPPHYTSYF